MAQIVELHAKDLTRRRDEQAALYRMTDRLYRGESVNDTFEAALDAISEGLGCDRASILLFDDAGVMKFVAWRGLSDGYRAAVEGHSPWKPSDKDPSPIFVADIDDTDEPATLKAIIKSEGIRGLAFIPIVARGKTIGKFMTYHEMPHTFGSDEIDLAVTIARQIGFSVERWKAEQDRRETGQTTALLASIVQSSDDGIISKKLDGTIISWNEGAQRLFGYTPDEIIGSSIMTLIPEAHHNEEHDIISRIRRGERVEHFETVRRRKDGSLIDLSITVSPIRDASGEIVGASKIARDISERRKADEHRSLMVHELNHRVNNTLATVQALASQTLPDSAGRTSFEGRIMALSRAHDILTSENWQGAWLREVAVKALSPFEANGRLALGGPPVRVLPKQAVALSMALHELATNAAKYGALSNDTGKVELIWRRMTAAGGRGQLQLTWTETHGPPVQAPTRTGFGSRLIGGLASELEGTTNFDFRPTGLVFTLSAAAG